MLVLTALMVSPALMISPLFLVNLAWTVNPDPGLNRRAGPASRNETRELSGQILIKPQRFAASDKNSYPLISIQLYGKLNASRKDSLCLMK